MSRDPKTIEQLEHEITYYARQIQHTTSPDRIARAHKAIRIRERQLTEARRQLAPASITCPRCHLVSHNPSDVRERYCGFCHRFHDDPAPDPPDNALQRVRGGDRR